MLHNGNARSQEPGEKAAPPTHALPDIPALGTTHLSGDGDGGVACTCEDDRCKVRHCLHNGVLRGDGS